MPALDIEIPYVVREQFMPLHQRDRRWACMVAHRRAGKTVACINDLVRAAVTCTKREPRFAYVAPHYVQAKDIAWSYLKYYSFPIPGITINEGELHITYPNGARIRLYGADNYNRMRGIYLDGVVLDEPADFHPAAWPEVIRPALSDRQGWATFIGTPKGRNFFYDVFEMAKDNPKEWFSIVLRASETGLLPDEELTDARKSLTPEQYEQEYECSFDAAILGAYFGREMAEADRQGRICTLERVPRYPIQTAWDLGMGDSTAIWVFQVVPGAIHVLDHIENHNQTLAYYAAELKARGYVGGTDWLPHDAKVRSIETGRTRVETLAALGRNVRLVPDHKLQDGISAGRMALAKTWFDSDKCKYGMECLRQYRSDYDDKAKVFKNAPKHDWTSHTADAFRYLAIAYNELVPVVAKKPQTKVDFPPLTVADLLRSSVPERKWT